MGQSYTIDQLPDLPSPFANGDLMIVTRGVNEYKVSGVQISNPTGYLPLSQTGNLVDLTSPQSIRGPKTFTDTTNFSGVNVSSGQVIMPLVSKTGTYNVTNSDFTIKCSGSFSVNLINASPTLGRIINVKNVHSGIILLTPSPTLIDGSTSPRSLISGICLTIQGDGANWIII